LVALAFDLFERIRLVSMPVAAVVPGASPRIDLDATLPDALGLFTVRVDDQGADQRPFARALFPAADDFEVSAAFLEIRWNALGTGGRPLVWQVVQSSQRTTTRFPDLPEAPSLLAQMRPPTTSASDRGDLDRATHAVYGFADRRAMTAARPLLATERFHGNLAGPPVLPRALHYWSSIAPGRFSYDD
jgi:hypothetical protein